LADFAAYDIIETALKTNADCLKSCPEIEKMRKNVKADPKIKEYLAKRKPCDY
jgi:hypothetical protein